MRVRELPERPRCENCGSPLLALLKKEENPGELLSLLRRWRKGETLSDEERDRLSYSRKTADLILSYGKRAITALLVHGVGPQTAYHLLSRMHREERELYRDLLRAKIQYLKNRPYWDERASS